MTNIDCPCEECITLSVCRYKQYLDMFSDCYLIVDYLHDFNHGALRDEKKLKLLFKTIKPKYWILQQITRGEVREAGDKRFKGKLMVHSIDEDGEVFNR